MASASCVRWISSAARFTLNIGAKGSKVNVLFSGRPTTIGRDGAGSIKNSAAMAAWFVVILQRLHICQYRSITCSTRKRSHQSIICGSNRPSRVK
jgi:hypothetical protein